MKKKFKKLLALLLVASLLVVLSCVNAKASDDEKMIVDGHTIDVVSNDDDEASVSISIEGATYTLSLDKEDGDFSLLKEEYPASIFGIGIGKPDENVYDVDVKDTTDDCIVAEAVNVEDESDTVIVDDTEVVAQAALVIGAGLGYILTLLLEALLALAATIIVAGIVYYAAKSIAKSLKKKQPGVHYYRAYLGSKDDVYIGPKFKSKSSAASHMASGGHVFAISSGYAYDVCKSASPIRRVSNMQKHAGEGKYYRHYHPMLTIKKQSRSHCWFI